MADSSDDEGGRPLLSLAAPSSSNGGVAPIEVGYGSGTGTTPVVVASDSFYHTSRRRPKDRWAITIASAALVTAVVTGGLLVAFLQDPLVNVPGPVRGIGGYVARPPAHADVVTLTTFLESDLYLELQAASSKTSEGTAPNQTTVALLPNGDSVAVADVQLSPFWTQLDALVAVAAARRGIPVGRSHCNIASIEVDDVKAWARHLRDNDIELLGPVQSGWGTGNPESLWQLFLAPDGNVMRVVTTSGRLNGSAASAPAAAAAAPALALPASTPPATSSRRGDATPHMIEGVRYIGSYYNDSSLWWATYDMWTNVFGLTPTHLTRPGDGDFTTMSLPNQDKIQMYYRCNIHVRFLRDNCTSPGLEVGSYADLQWWNERLTGDDIEVALPLYRYHETQGWGWYYLPFKYASGVLREIVSPVLELVASDLG